MKRRGIIWGFCIAIIISGMDISPIPPRCIRSGNMNAVGKKTKRNGRQGKKTTLKIMEKKKEDREKEDQEEDQSKNQLQ